MNQPFRFCLKFFKGAGSGSMSSPPKPVNLKAWHRPVNEGRLIPMYEDLRPGLRLQEHGNGMLEVMRKDDNNIPLEIQVSTNSGQSWQLLAFINTRSCLDNTVQQGFAHKRSYRAIYHDSQGRTGYWSGVVSKFLGGACKEAAGWHPSLYSV